ncbi:MAG: hypothetical protein ACP5JU_01145 [Minisyncoccia bacterium]
MLEKIRFYLTIILGSILYIFLIFKFFDEAKRVNFNFIFSLNNLTLIIISFFLTIFLILSQSLFLKTILKSFDIEINLKESIDYWLIFVATGVFTAGLSMPILIFNKLKNLKRSYSESIFIIILYYLIYILSIFLLFTIFFFKKFYLVLFLIFLTIFIILLKIPYEFLEKKEKFLKGILTAILIPFLSEFIYFLFFLISFNIVKINLGLSLVLKSFLVSQIFSIISPTGGGLGFIEPILIYYLSLFKLNMAKIILATFLYRFFTFWIPAFLGAFIIIKRKIK